MKQEQFDIVHCNTPIGGVTGRICARRAHVPFVIYQAHDFHFWKGAPLKNWLCYYPVERMLAHFTDRLVTINEEDYHRATSFHLKKSGQVIKVPGVGVNVARFSETKINEIDRREELETLGIPQNACVFLSVGELIPRKNFKMLIHAFKKANIPDAYLLICGDGSDKEVLQNTIDSMTMQSNIKLLGFRSDILELLHCTDYFVFPSKQEGLPGALMEAMAAKRPCIISRIRGNIDLLGSDYDYLLNPDDIDAWSNAIKQILQDKRDLGEYAYKRVKPFDFPRVVESYKNLYQDAIEARQRIS